MVSIKTCADSTSSFFPRRKCFATLARKKENEVKTPRKKERKTPRKKKKKGRKVKLEMKKA